MIEILRTTTDDPRFLSLVSELDAELWRRYGDTQAQYATHNVIAAVPTVLALDDGQPVGCGCWKPHGPATGELKRMFVRPEVRGRAIAARIVAALEAWAGEEGVTTMVLETGIHQPEAIALYTRCGYARIDRFAPYVDMPDSVCMSRSLVPGRAA